MHRLVRSWPGRALIAGSAAFLLALWTSDLRDAADRDDLGAAIFLLVFSMLFLLSGRGSERSEPLKADLSVTVGLFGLALGLGGLIMVLL